MALQGPLRELGIHDVFQLLDLGRKTGVLRITSELRQNEGTVWVHNAAVVAAAIRSNPHPLGTALLRAGKIQQEDLTRARAMQEAGDTRRLGEILVSIGAISPRDVERQARAQIEEVVFTVLGWSEGHFVFEDLLLEDIPREAGVRISTESLLLEAARRIDEWSRIQGKVPHLGVVPRLAPPPPQLDPGSLTLLPGEWRLLARVEGRNDIRTLAAMLGESDFDVARTLFGLAAAGVILLNDPTAESLAARQDPATMLRQGEEHLRLGDAESARFMAGTVISSFPDMVEGYLLLGRAWLVQQGYTEAREALREATHRSPEVPQAWRLLGFACVGTARFDEAVAAWEQWRSLGLAESAERQFEPAILLHLEAARSLGSGLRDRHGR